MTQERGGRARSDRAARAARFVALGFAAGIGLSVVLLTLGSGASPTAGWGAGVAVPQPLPAGAHVVDDKVPVAIVPDVTAWTGSHLLTLGVRGNRNVGAAYEPATGRWRTLPPPPFGVALRGAVGVWTGDEWVVAGVLCERLVRQPDGHDGCVPGYLAAAAYHPVSDLWQPVHANPVPAEWGFGPGHPPTVGRAVGRVDRAALFVIDGHYYAVRARAGTWTGLPDPPRLDRPGSDVDVGVCALDTAAVATAAVRRDGEPHSVDTVAVAVLAPGARTWKDAGSVAPRSGTARVVTACTRSGVLVSAPDLSWVAQWDLRTRAWEEVTLTDQLAAAEGELVVTEAGQRVVFSGAADALAYDPRRRTWSPLPPGLPPNPARVVWTSPRTGLAFDRRALVAYDAGG